MCCSPACWPACPPLAAAGPQCLLPVHSNPAQTSIQLPDAHHWIPNQGYPERSVDMCPLVGSTTEAGLYCTLVRWWPGYMSAPHTYTTDRLCVVVSGTWWCNSGPDFDPAACVPVPAGSFVRRVAGTPHYDGVIRGHPDPAIIAICGTGAGQLQGRSIRGNPAGGRSDLPGARVG